MILPNPLTIGQKVAAAALAAFIVFAAGAWAGGKLVNNHWKAREAVRIEAEHQEYARLAGIAQGIGQALATETRRRQADARAHRAEIEKWRNHGTVEIQCPAGSGLTRVSPDDVRFGADYVDLWNAGLRLGLPAASGPGRPDAAPGRADPPSATELLANTAENAESCNADRARLRAAQKYLKEMGAAK